MIRKIRNLALVIVFIFLALFLFRKWDIVPSFNDLFAEKPVEVDNAPLVVQQIKNIAQLMTIEAHQEVVVDSVRLPNNKNPFAHFNPLNPFARLEIPRIVLVVKGRVIAGMDLQKLRAQHIYSKGDSISVILPKATVLEVITNPSDVETFIEKGKWSPQEVTAVKQKAASKIVQLALEQEMLKRAEEKAVRLLQNLLKGAGYQKINIIIQHPLG